jgi:hypothetical protein
MHHVIVTKRYFSERRNMTRIISAGLLCLSVILAGISTQAQASAVSSFNGDLSMTVMQIDDPNAEFKIYTVSANGNIPLAGYLGLNLRVMGGHGDVKSPLGDYGYDYQIYSVSPFVRDPKLGLLGLSVGRTVFDVETTPPTSRIKLNDLGLLAAGYFGPVTIAATYLQARDVDGTTPDQRNGWVDATWYVTPDLLINATAGFDEARDSYGIAFEHQLSSLSPHLSYGLSYARDNNLEDRTILFSLTYRFADKKSLMKRYREDLFAPR